MILITTSQSVVAYEPEHDRLRNVLDDAGMGFFGIVPCPDRNRILVAGRTRSRGFLLNLWDRARGRLSSGALLYPLNPETLRADPPFLVKDVHGVHQIACHGQHVFLTDTGKNRVPVYHLESRSLVKMINLGPVREDINHVNAIRVLDGNLVIGLNNGSAIDSQLLRLPLEVALQKEPYEIDAFQFGTFEPQPGIRHSHDIQPYRGGLIACASRDGFVYRMKTGERLLNAEGWVRGLAPTDEGLWVGMSVVAPRGQRHLRDQDGGLKLYAHDTFELLRRVTLPKVGQVCELMVLPGA